MDGTVASWPWHWPSTCCTHHAGLCPAGKSDGFVIFFWFILEFEIVPKEMHEFDSHGTVWMGARATNQLVYDEEFP